MTTEKQIIRVDASSLSKSNCSLRWHRAVVEGWRTRKTPNDVAFGSAFHLYRKLRNNGMQQADALSATLTAWSNAQPSIFIKPNKKHLTESYLVQVCVGYDIQYCVDSLEVLHSEIRFAAPYKITEKYEVLICGTIDVIGKLNSECYVISDYKTTHVWNAEEYLMGYYLSSQLMFYRLAIEKFANSFPQNEFMQGVNSKSTGCMIDGVFLTAKGSYSYKRSDVIFFKEEQLRAFERMVERRVDELLLRKEQEGIVNGTCETKFGRCELFESCLMPDEESSQMMLEKTMHKTEYNPMTFGEL